MKTIANVVTMEAVEAFRGCTSLGAPAHRGSMVGRIPQKRAAEALPWRWLWTWDHSTHWAADLRGRQESGAHNAYLKSARTFLDDYYRLIDYAAGAGINGLIVWGLLRDSHGGVAAARKICRRAKTRGVRILAGIGCLSYGGPYYDGKSPWNLPCWLRRHPRLRAATARRQSAYGDVACPSREENLRWLEKGVAWVLAETGAHGVNLETGDYGVCACRICQQRRRRFGREPGVALRGAASIADMVTVYGPALAAARSACPEGWHTFATYRGLGRTDVALYRAMMEHLPADAIAQVTLTDDIGIPRTNFIREFGAGGRALFPSPFAQTVGFLHQGSQWYYDTRRNHLLLDALTKGRNLAQNHNLHGLIIHGEVSPRDDFAWRLNYPLLGSLLTQPTIRPDVAIRQVLTPLLGRHTAAFWHAYRDPSRHALEAAVSRRYQVPWGSPQFQAWDWLCMQIVQRLR